MSNDHLILEAPEVNYFGEFSGILTTPHTVVISPGVNLSGVITVRYGCRIVFEGWTIIHDGAEFRFEHPRGPLDWNGHPYR